MTQKKYKIQEVKKGTTERGATYFDITAVEVETGELVLCTYFGNTTPKKLLRVETTVSKNGDTYNIAVIQPHTSRDKKTGRFICGTSRTKA